MAQMSIPKENPPSGVLPDMTWQDIRLLQWQGNVRRYSPVPKSMDVIFHVLLQKGLITRKPRHSTPEYFISYDSSRSCDYHSGEIGHTLDDYNALKNRIQDLLDARAITFHAP